MADGVSVREFAKQIGKSHVWVLKLLKAGKLPRNSDGTIPLEAGLNTYNQMNGEAPGSPNPVQVKRPPVNFEEKQRQTQEAVSVNAALKKAQLAEKTFNARLRELEYKMKSGELLEKDSVSHEAQWLAEQVRAKLMAIPPRISSMCEGRLAREIEEIITDAISGALKELQKCKYTEGD